MDYNAMYVRDVKDIQTCFCSYQILCLLKHVRDVEDRLYPPMDCNAMYVGDVETCFCSLLPWYSTDFQSGKSFGKLRFRAFQPYYQILYILRHVGDVKDRSYCIAACYREIFIVVVGDVRDGSSNYIVYHNSNYSNWEILWINASNYMKLWIKTLY